MTRRLITAGCNSVRATSLDEETTRNSLKISCKQLEKRYLLLTGTKKH